MGAMTLEPAPPRIGRPPKLDDEGRPTRERLLAAATAACVEHGFEAVTVSDIAKRADVSTPAIYNHFSGKSELIVEACRLALEGIRPASQRAPVEPHEVIRRYLSDEFADARTLQLELHLAAQRHPDVADLLATWHGEHTARWVDAGADVATVKAWYLLLLGIAQVDALSSLATTPAELEACLQPLVAALFSTD